MTTLRVELPHSKHPTSLECVEAYVAVKTRTGHVMWRDHSDKVIAISPSGRCFVPTRGPEYGSIVEVLGELRIHIED